MASFFQKQFIAPRLPNTAAGFADNQFSVVELRRARGAFQLGASAVTPLPAELLTPQFDERNIHDVEEAAALVQQTAQAAGLGNRRRWSVALPEGAARTIVIALESKPQGRRELNEILAWKLERVIPTPAAELRISRQRLRPAGGQERYLVTVARDAVVAEYEDLFARVGWQAGLLLPRHLGEAQWLMWERNGGDKMLVSANRLGFTSVVVRGGEPTLVRLYECEPEARADELHRFTMYYHDRLAEAKDRPAIDSLLVLGELDAGAAREAVADALGQAPRLLDPVEFGIDLRDEPIQFHQLAGAGGLASLAYQ